MTSPASIIVVGYRAYEELDRCLASIERFEPDAEVIVVDHDADRTRGPQLAAAHPRVRYIARAENPGFSAGVNFGARHASASLLLLLNPDVELHAPVIAPLAAAVEADRSIGIVGGRVREHDGAIQPSARRFPDLTTAFGGRTSWLSRVAPGNPLTRRNLASSDGTAGTVSVDWVTGAFMLIRREVFDRAGGFDERFFLYWEDADFCRRALAAGFRTVYDPRGEVVHLTGRASRHAPVRSLVAFHRSVFYYYWKHGSWTARLLSPAVALGLTVRLIFRLVAASRSR